MAQPIALAPTRKRPAGKGSDFAPLLREVKEAGLLERRTASYVIAITLNVVLLAATWAGVVMLGNSWLQLLLAVPLAILTTRAAFFGHDAGHQQISSSRKLHDVVGMLHGNLLCGMSYGWWNDKHNRHHANPNHTDKDPDVGEGILVWTLEQAEGRTGLYGWLTRNQAKIFFPLLTLEGLNLKVSSVSFLIGKRRCREARVELGLIAAHLVLYFGALFLIMSPGKVIAFAALHHALFGLHLGSVFAPNHKGMEMPDGDTDWGHLEKQVLTSRNVRGGLVVDWMMGGLNYQIEHHLFPTMARANLGAAHRVVLPFCQAQGIPFEEASIWESYRQTFAALDRCGQATRGA